MMQQTRKQTHAVKVGGLIIGGDAPVSVQSMTNYPLEDVAKNIDQINRMKDRGANLVRLAVMTVDSVKYLREILRETDIPLCADIHFDYRIALAAIEAGIHKIRINPGNIGSEARTREVVRAAKDRGVPIRIGVNGGSIDKQKYPSPTPVALVDSALGHVKILEDLDFSDIVVSIKASDVKNTVEANRLFSSLRSYPLHVGLTEAGYGLACVVSSSAAIGSLLLDGIGDTIRVSMTGDPVEEIDVGYEILKSLGLVSYGIRIISCPTCGRTDPTINLEKIARGINDELTARFGGRLKNLNRLVVIAVMGCEVNGPGEACHADIGVAGARNGNFILFSHGEKIEKISSDALISRIAEQIDQMLSAKQ
jgi:(E)-4-hydroxy-3-methylbut-2-enyl-diphosphate synthase